MTVWSRRSRRPDPTGPSEAAGPLALVLKDARGLILHALNRQARALGLTAGQTQADAQAMVPHLITIPADPETDHERLRQLALWLERYSPTVAMDLGPRGLEGLFLDVTGIPHLFGGEAAMLADLRQRLNRAAIPARLAMAGTPGAAWALARFGSEPALSVANGQERAALAHLPVAALRLAPEAVQLLARFGLRRIGDLYALPRAALARRFRGAALSVILALDRADGFRDEPLRAERTPEAYQALRRVFEPVITREAVAQMAADLVTDLAMALERDGRGARCLRLTGFRVDGQLTEFETTLAAPARKPAHLLRLLADKGWERLDLGFGIDALQLSAPQTEPLIPGQTDALITQGLADAEAHHALIDRLTARLGPGAVLVPRQQESWLPERADHLVPHARRQTLDRELESGPPRPVLLLDPPEPIEAVAELPDGAPARFNWRHVVRRVVRASGPERLAPEWWRPMGRPSPYTRMRDYYRVEDEAGGRYWLFRAGLYGRDDPAQPPSWWMHGLFP